MKWDMNIEHNQAINDIEAGIMGELLSIIGLIIGESLYRSSSAAELWGQKHYLLVC